MSSRAGALRLARVSEGHTASGRQLLAATGVTLLVLFAALALWLIVRRLGGAFTQPLSGPGIVAAAVAIAVTTHFVNWILTSTRYSVLSTRYQSYLSPTATCAAIMLLGSLTLPGTPTWGLVVAWLVLLGGEAARWSPSIRPHLNHILPRPGRSATAPRPTEATMEAEIPAGLVQQMTRVREENRESIHVLASTQIPDGERLGVIHISFCPPLPARPQLTAHAMEADDVDVRLTQAEAFGARIEVRTSQAQAEPRSVVIEVLGSVTDRQSA